MIRKLAAKVGWPLVALAAAFALWITFVGSPENVSSVSVPVHYRNMPLKLEPVVELPRHVTAEIQGSSAKLRAFSGAQTAAVIDLEGIEEGGEHTVNIDPENIDLPAGVRCVRIEPAQLKIRFERRMEVEVPVSVRYSEPPSGYRIASAQVSPPKLTISGAENRVRQIHAVETDPLDLTQVFSRKQFQVSALLPDAQVRFVSPPVVQVSVTLERAAQEGTAPDGKTAVRN